MIKFLCVAPENFCLPSPDLGVSLCLILFFSELIILVSPLKTLVISGSERTKETHFDLLYHILHWWFYLAHLLSEMTNFNLKSPVKIKQQFWISSICSKFKINKLIDLITLPLMYPMLMKSCFSLGFGDSCIVFKLNDFWTPFRK